ncbi:rust resistance kinase Lr10-like [Triticum urartu]|uniref:RING-type E3 ubiquitin transferase n=1 Tax=Triticum urartu TaxID=4572 RepID=A0A8R7P1R8_TRIUA|nr:rust resistance kinase Lr10-like [Triticum urartu]
MSRTLSIAVLLLSLLSPATDMATASAWDDKDFFKHCPPSWCSKDGPEIRFPLRLESSNSSSSCGATCAKITCSGQDTILLHPLLGPCKVTAIDYSRAAFSIVPLVDSCPLQKLISINLTAIADVDRCALYESTPGKLVHCSSVFTPSGTAEFAGGIYPKNTADNIFGPISCFSNQSQFAYFVMPRLYMYVLPLDCKVISHGNIPIPNPSTSMHDPTFKQLVETITNFAETTATWENANWDNYGSIPSSCTRCELQGRPCAFSSKRHQVFCMDKRPHGSRVKVIAATSSVTAFIVLSVMVATTIYLSLKSRYNEEINMKVEMFLKAYGTSKPTRYTFPEVKKIARRFKDKLGQGGFGSVYKGEL